MATTDEIRRRVEEADTARSARRAAAAQHVGELTQRRAAIAEQLADIERQLGDVLATAQEVIDVDELARFTDVPAAELRQCLSARKSARTKRKRAGDGAPSAHTVVSREPAAARKAPAGPVSTGSEPAVSGVAADSRVPAEVT